MNNNTLSYRIGQMCALWHLAKKEDHIKSLEDAIKDPNLWYSVAALSFHQVIDKRNDHIKEKYLQIYVDNPLINYDPEEHEAYVREGYQKVMETWDVFPEEKE